MLELLYEDNHCLAVSKPAGMLTQADATGAPCLVDQVREYLRARYHKPGNVFVGLVHRLDRPVSGVVLLARTSKAAARLSEQFRSGSVGKTYVAIVEGQLAEDAGVWTDPLLKDPQRNVVSIVRPGTPGAQAARLTYRVLERTPRSTVVELRPNTGRGHQLRVQLAARGHPIVGDIKYGARSSVRASDGRNRIALHALELIFTHPTRREAIAARAPLPADWPGGGRTG